MSLNSSVGVMGATDKVRSRCSICAVKNILNASQREAYVSRGPAGLMTSASSVNGDGEGHPWPSCLALKYSTYALFANAHWMRALVFPHPEDCTTGTTKMGLPSDMRASRMALKTLFTTSPVKLSFVNDSLTTGSKFSLGDPALAWVAVLLAAACICSRITCRSDSSSRSDFSFSRSDFFSSGSVASSIWRSTARIFSSTARIFSSAALISPTTPAIFFSTASICC
mmetsp:Transcript_46442/g.109099  ORF Transcript_46442/g.109099 Transcript_46442/m.109099 type:complete len:226 (-) Transcript_46442:233-910(-)